MNIQFLLNNMDTIVAPILEGKLSPDDTNRVAATKALLNFMYLCSMDKADRAYRMTYVQNLYNKLGEKDLNVVLAQIEKEVALYRLDNIL